MIRYTLIVFLSMIFLMTVSSCEPDYKLSPNGKIERKIGSIVASKLKSTNKVKFDLKQIASFEWDLVYIIPSNTVISDISSKVGVDFEELGKINLEENKIVNVLAFVKDKKLIDYSVIERSKGNFPPSTSIKFYTPEKAVFEIVQTDKKFISGEPVMDIINIHDK